MNHAYQAFYCEENIWQLSREFPKSQIIFILNEGPATQLYYQRASPHPFIPIYWDYHVILQDSSTEKTLIYDLDSYLPFPIVAEEYWESTLNLNQEPLDANCRLRIIPAADYQRYFSSDRSHMKDDEGNWLKPPPSWDCIQSKSLDPYFLVDILDTRNTEIGELVTLEKWLK